jgi:metallo-beta-lactamase family protein
MAGLSGHGDYSEIEQWLGHSELSANTAIHLVHGEPGSLEGMRDHLRHQTPYRVEVAQYRITLLI